MTGRRIAAVKGTRRHLPPALVGRPEAEPLDCHKKFSTLRSYNVGSVQSDKYTGSWVVESLAAQGIRCEQSAEPKSSLYTNLLPLLNSNRIELPPELLQRVAAMPAARKYTAWGFRRRAALANMAIPREQQCYPRSVLPAEKFEKGGESR